MEKKEARIKCSGCGATYKVKVPVTDKPVSFKCKKCGKVLKLKIKPTAASEEAPKPSPGLSLPQMPELETSQLPDLGAYQDLPGPQKVSRPSVVEHLFLDQPDDAPVSHDDKSRSWIVLANDVIKGPLTDQEIVKMIKTGDVTAETSLRMGERPWIKAAEVPAFRTFFPGWDPGARAGTPASMSLLEKQGLGVTEGDTQTGPHFYEELSTLASYPFSGGKGMPLVIFAAIAFLFSTILSLDFLLGLPLNLLGWVLLYGYLAALMRASIEAPHSPPPPWDFSHAKALAYSGLNVLVLLAVYSLIPVGTCVLLMIFFFLNSMPAFGYIFFALAILIYLGSLFVLPCSLTVLGGTGNIRSALSISNVMRIIRDGGRPYSMLAILSMATGLVCMLAVAAGLFLVDVDELGFLVSGLVMALILSYGHFIWFHILGRFVAENPRLVKQAAQQPAN